MKFSKVIYLLMIGAALAVFAFLIDFNKTIETEEKELIVPLVKDKVDAKPIEIKKNEIKSSETIKLEVVRVRPDGSLVIAGKGLPNSKIEILSGSKIIATTLTDKIGDFVAIPEEQLKSGEFILSFKQISQDGKVIIADKSVAINVTGNERDTPIVAILDDKGELGAKLVQAPGLKSKNEDTKKENDTDAVSNTINVQKEPNILILALTYDSEIGQLILSGEGYGGVQVNAGFSGQEISSSKISNDEWSVVIPGKVIAGKQKIFAYLLGKEGKVLSKSSLIISGKAIERANGKTIVIVQKGDALWNIAYQRLGLGTRYLDIVKLNKDKISNPDLIYPKQLFILPNKLAN